MCKTTSTPCPVAQAVPSSRGLSAYNLRRLLPCGGCHGGKDHALALPGLRLGSLERRILQAVALPSQKYFIVPPHAAGLSAEEARRRAQRKLSRAGLLSPEKVVTGTGSVRRKIGVRLTPLGRAVVGRVELTAGKSIRWQQHQSALIADIQMPFEELVASFEEAVVEYKRERGVKIGQTIKSLPT
ncbi:MAG: hypothetical protein H7836_16045 [Magnetococcus sp. YQC-3]